MSDPSTEVIIVHVEAVEKVKDKHVVIDRLIEIRERGCHAFHLVSILSDREVPGRRSKR